MRYPLDTIFITGQFKEKAVPGTGLKDSAGTARHIGVDYRAAIGTTVYAPGDGVVTQSYTAGSGNQIIEIRIGGYLWRFLHLSSRLVKAGDHVREGQVIAKSGNTGGVAAHLHVDTRKDGTTYNASLNNYVNPRDVIEAANRSQGGNNVILTEEAVKTLYRRLFNREGDPGGVKNYTGKTLDFALGDMLGSEEFKNLHVKTVEKVVEKRVEVPAPVSAQPDPDGEKWRKLKALNKDLLS